MILYSKFTPNENNNFYFKKYLFISIITYFLTIFFLSYLLSIDVNQFWFFLGVPAKEKIFSDIQSRKSIFKHLLSIKLKNQLRKTPGLIFFIDNSLEHYDAIDQILKSI